MQRRLKKDADKVELSSNISCFGVFPNSDGKINI